MDRGAVRVEVDAGEPGREPGALIGRGEGASEARGPGDGDDTRRDGLLDGVEGGGGEPHEVVEAGGAPGDVFGGESAEAGEAEGGEVLRPEPGADAGEAEVEGGLGVGEGVQRLAELRETVGGWDDGPGTRELGTEHAQARGDGELVFQEGADAASYAVDTENVGQKLSDFVDTPAQPILSPGLC